MLFLSFYGEDGTGKTETSLGVATKIKNSYIVKSTTTKKPRYKGDTEYYFVSKENFFDNEMIEWEEFAGEYYGLQVSEVTNNLDKKVLLYVAEANGIVNTDIYLSKHFPKFKKFKFHMDISKEVIRKNIEKENKYSEEEINKRLSRSNVVDVANKLNLTPDHTIIFLNENTINLAYSKIRDKIN